MQRLRIFALTGQHLSVLSVPEILLHHQVHHLAHPAHQVHQAHQAQVLLRAILQVQALLFRLNTAHSIQMTIQMMSRQ